MVRKDKVRFTISMTKDQAKWLSQFAKKLGISKSRTIRWLISKNVGNLLASQKYTDEELKRIIEICKTPWLPDDDED